MAQLTGLGAAGSLAEGAAGIATAIEKSKAASKLLEETKRHSKEGKTKSGKGIFLRQPPKGKGLHLKPHKK